MVLSAFPATAQLTATEKRGRAIYLSGAPTGTAVVAGADLPATSLACGSCHGPDGRGVPEGTIVPKDIRKLRPRYDDAALRKAITHGVDPAGIELSTVMPRYRLAAADLTDLIAYLNRLNDPSPGVTPAELTITTTIPHELTRTIVAAFVKDLNTSGGIYGRTLALTSDVDKAFAIVCAAATTIDPHERIPILTPFPTTAPPATSYFLYPDIETQALSLARSIEPGAHNVAIVHTDAQAAAEALKAYGESQQWTFDGTKPPDLLFLLGRVDPAHLDSKARIFIAGATLTPELLASKRNITVAVPTLPGDVHPEAQEELDAFAARHQLARSPVLTATFATMKVFVEALKRTGRDLTREKFIAAMEQLYEFPTGYTPPVTFNRNRHIGTAGAYVVSLESGKRVYVPARP
ncbi:MAG TPA: ABC transporter substrate-binding protein [Thermoanaerobaculia bacterium]